MTLTFKPVDAGNLMPIVKMHAGPGQPWVMPNAISIAQSKVDPNMLPFGIYADDALVGFTMYALRRDRQELYLYRLMLDEPHQHRGYGRAALERLVEIARREPGIRRIRLTTNPGNTHGIRVYKRFGFKATGVMHEVEAEFVLDL